MRKASSARNLRQVNFLIFSGKAYMVQTNVKQKNKNTCSMYDTQVVNIYNTKRALSNQ